MKSQIIQLLKARIKQLNEADAEFCKDRWDMNKPHNERSIYREESNKVTFARQDHESMLKKITDLPESSETEALISEIRTAFADYLASEGCSCCQDKPKHDIALDKIGKLLQMQKYEDGSGYDYGKYQSKK
jgi:hypothetical protein